MSAAAAVACAEDDDAAVMSHTAHLNARQFRTMLRVLARGMHVDQAVELLRLRAATGLELQADDCNT
jgi:hypothetical protein